jgi:hypothetical protein
MAKENPGFTVVGEVEQPAVPQADPNRVAVAMILLATKTLSQRALTAATDLFTLITVGGAFYLWMVTPSPTDRQIISLSIYALFTLAANYIVRRT